MSKAKTCFCSAVLAATMLGGLLPLSAFAAEGTNSELPDEKGAKIKVEYTTQDDEQKIVYYSNESNDDRNLDKFWDPVSDLGASNKNAKGQATITLLDDITLSDTTILVDLGKNIVIDGQGQYSITWDMNNTVSDKSQPGNQAVSIANAGDKLQLKDVTLNVVGTGEGNANQGIVNYGDLTVDNSTLNLSKLGEGFNGSGSTSVQNQSKVMISDINGSAMKANTVSVIYSQVDVKNVVYHGISAGSVSIMGDASVAIDKVGYLGIAATDSVSINGENTKVSVTNSGTASYPAVRVGTGTFTLDGASLTLTGNGPATATVDSESTDYNVVKLNSGADATVTGGATLTGGIDVANDQDSVVKVSGAVVTGTVSNNGTGSMEISNQSTVGGVSNGSTGALVISNASVTGAVVAEGAGTVAVVGSSVGQVTGTNASNVIYSNATVGGEKQEDSDLSGAVAIDSKGQTYTSLDGAGGALDSVKTSGETITLVKNDVIDQADKNAIAAGVTLVVSKGTKLTINSNGAGFLKSQGVLQVNAGGSLEILGEVFIGTNDKARFNLTAGSISLDMGNKKLNVEENSKVSVPKDKKAYLFLGTTDDRNALKVTVNSGAEVAVDGTLKLANGNELTVDPNAVMNISSGGILDMSSKATVNGKITIYGVTYVADSSDATAPGNSAELVLSAGGQVYSAEKDLSAVKAMVGILSKQAVSHSYDDKTFKLQYSVIIPDDGGSTTTPTSYGITVSTAENGTVKSSNSSAAKDATVTITVTPNEGYVLDTLTVTDKDNNTVALTKVSDTQYTFKMPASAVTVKATFKKDEGTQPAALPFNDVSESEWFYEAVKYVYDKGMMNGVSDTAFAPYSNLTRGMIAQVLYNLEGKPAVSGSAYTDVAADQWYNDAVNWAAQKGIVTGYGDGTFGPMDNITREQMAAILYRYAQYKGYDVSAKGDLTAFTDGNTVSDWAKDAMSWAVGTALFNGKGDGILDPTTTATRAEVAKILMTYCENVAK